MTEHVAGRDYRVSASGFWQVHPAAASTLQNAVLDFAQPKPGEWALDLYCGVGLFAAALAEAVGPTGAVLGIESEPPTVQDARHNLRDLPQAQTERGKVEEALDRLDIQQADLVVCDPPRSGLGRPVVTRIATLTPSRIVYVSCDPATLSRDLNWFAELGYDLAELRAFDQYPMTHHVECVALLVGRTT
jgi:tRNA/tmRNA/rRNA uracil-C5-methylase (TrmA/RlmC/RlmD family)